MRPQSVRLFDILFLGGIAIGLLNMLGLTLLRPGEIEASAVAAGLDPGSAKAALWSALAFGTVVALTLWYLVSRMRMGWLRWVLVLLVVFGLYNMPQLLTGGFDLNNAVGILASLLQTAAVAFLFRSDAKAYLAAQES